VQSYVTGEGEQDAHELVAEQLDVALELPGPV
jgi:hypothetical protein